MTRHHHDRRPKKSGGLLMGMRQKVKSAAGAVTDEAPKSKVKIWLANIATGVVVLIAAALLLRRCGVIKF